MGTQSKAAVVAAASESSSDVHLADCAAGCAEYDLERERTTERNLAMLRQLGLLGAKDELRDACKKPAKVIDPSRLRSKSILGSGPQ